MKRTVPDAFSLYTRVMDRRPQSLIGLSLRLLKIKWLAADRSTKVGLIVALIAVGLFAATSARCMLRSSCGASGGCPYSGAAADYDSPCSR
jgi:hypothetical protein